MRSTVIAPRMGRLRKARSMPILMVQPAGKKYAQQGDSQSGPLAQAEDHVKLVVGGFCVQIASGKDDGHGQAQACQDADALLIPPG